LRKKEKKKKRRAEKKKEKKQNKTSRNIASKRGKGEKEKAKYAGSQFAGKSCHVPSGGQG